MAAAPAVLQLRSASGAQHPPGVKTCHNLISFVPHHAPWNSGRLIGSKPPFQPKHVWAIRQQLKTVGRIRDLALFDLAVDSKLRGCDLVQLRIGQLVISAAARQRATIALQKTRKPVQFELKQQIREGLIVWRTYREGGLQDFVFPSRTDSNGHISTRQYARLWAIGSRASEGVTATAHKITL